MTQAETLAERLRGWFQAIQRSKEGRDRLQLAPFISLVNAVPEIVAALEKHDEFLRDLQLEVAEDGKSTPKRPFSPEPVSRHAWWAVDELWLHVRDLEAKLGDLPLGVSRVSVCAADLKAVLELLDHAVAGQDHV